MPIPRFAVCGSLGWLPRGAMDLNFYRFDVLTVFDRWLPRGAMDLNFIFGLNSNPYPCWLPRGAMDLNRTAPSRLRPTLPLAPSWSHGSKFRLADPTRRLCLRWLPRGAMDLNNSPGGDVWAGMALAPSWSHGSK